MSDTYIDGGNWLEYKHVLVMRRKDVENGKRLVGVPEAKQREFMGRRLKNKNSSDRCFMGFVLHPPEWNEAWLVIGRFGAFCHEARLKWTLARAREFGVNFSDTEAIEAYVARIFGPDYDRNSNYDGEAACLGLASADLFI